jgi:hypothetical protein
MHAIPGSTWIRPTVMWESRAWHLETTTTRAGVMVTSCAVVMGPDEAVEVSRLDAIGEGAALCPACSDHAGLGADPGADASGRLS